MSRGRQHFRQSDLVKALKAMAKVGVSGRVEIDRDGKIVVIAGKAEQDDPSPLDQWRRERGSG
ncbi:hypothetical protein J4G48_0003435 [Bradyrhizobium barranii subsp. apii]|uniref:hypothetical protein n=1 Tax=Bradyrhizobium barranii TaxID=2992140 RepID=UPI001AA13A3F|nr:hypothetical protein [Bradyrhizobium barranii]UPT97248.1 hypothetical protein J4G48_0003435 [Bradyrhizobium barranii subsp. apii]